MAGQAAHPTFVVTNDQEFIAALNAAWERLKLRSVSHLEALVIEVQNRARRYCPVDTGRLRSSIQSRFGQDAHGHWGEVGTNVSYAAYVEYGTRRTKPQPFLRPALAESVASFARRAA